MKIIDVIVVLIIVVLVRLALKNIFKGELSKCYNCPYSKNCSKVKNIE